MSLDAGEVDWGRIPGSSTDQLALDFMAGAFAKLGLEVRRQPVDLPPMRYPRGCGVVHRGRQARRAAHDVPNRRHAADAAGGDHRRGRLGRRRRGARLDRPDLKGKAVMVYSTFVPGGRSHSASDRAGLFNSDTLGPGPGRR